MGPFHYPSIYRYIEMVRPFIDGLSDQLSDLLWGERINSKAFTYDSLWTSPTTNVKERHHPHPPHTPPHLNSPANHPTSPHLTCLALTS